MRLAAATLPLAALLAAAPARAAPFGLRLSPLGDLAVGIAWSTPGGPAEAVVRYGTDPRRLDRVARGRVRPGVPGLGPTSEVRLAGLRPGARYHYRAGGPRGGFSATFSFRAPPPPGDPCARFRMAYVGDSRAEAWQGDQGAADGWPLTLARVAAARPRLLLHGGDIVHDGRRPQAWWGYLAASRPWLAALPALYVLGNHDDGPGQGDGANYNRLFYLPRGRPALGGTGTEDAYAIRFGNVRLAVLSTETFRGGDRPFARQARWLDRALGRGGALWRIVLLHRPLYTRQVLGLFGHPPDEVGQNAALLPVLRRRRVDLVIASHNHFYERWAPSRCARPGGVTPCPVGPGEGGTVHVTSGGGGAFPIFFAGGTDRARPAATGARHHVLIDVDGPRLVLRAIARDGRLLDRLRLTRALPPGVACGRAPAKGSRSGRRR